MGHCDVHLLAHGDDVLVPDPAEGLGVLLEGEVGGAPLLEQGGQHVRRLPADDEQPRVELPQTRVQVLEALEKEPAIDSYVRQIIHDVIQFILLHLGRLICL